MADHRREQILDAIATALTGLVTTGANVFRGRSYPLDDASLPAILIYQGQDEPVPDASPDAVWNYIDSVLHVLVEPVAASASIQVDQVLNQIDKESWIALMASNNLGLAFVHSISPGLALEPKIAAEGDRPLGYMRRNWLVHYRSSRADPSA